MNGPLRFAAALPLALALLASCVGGPSPKPGTSLPAASDQAAVQAERAAIEASIAIGSPSALEKAVELAEGATRIPPADAKAYGWVAYEMARLVYPELAGELPPSAVSPPDSVLVRAFIDARNGKAVSPGDGAGPLLELFPALSIFRLRTAAAVGTTLAAVERFSRFGLPSAAADVARGIALERSGDRAGALSAFERGESVAADCYPASLGRARMLVALDRGVEALVVINRLAPSMAESAAARRIRAEALYVAGQWEVALPLITEVLLADPLDSHFALMRAHLLVERGEYRQAAPLLDAYGGINPTDRLYILLRARTAMESAKDRTAAAGALRTGLERYPNDPEMLLYAAEVFWKGGTEEKAEAVTLATKILAAEPSSARALRILLASDLAKGDFRTAASRADAILAAQPDFADLESLYAAYRGSGRTMDASRLAQSWRAKDPASEPAAIAWATSLVERGERTAALELIAQLLAGKGTDRKSVV